MEKPWRECFISLATEWRERDLTRPEGFSPLPVGNKALDKMRPEKLFLLMRELGKCSRRESVHKNYWPGVN